MSDRPQTIRDLVLSLGIDEREVDRADADGTLGLLAISRFIFPGEPRYTQSEAEQLTGLGPRGARYWRALGFSDPQPDERMFTDADVDMLRVVRQLLELGLVDEGIALQMARVIGASMARIAAAQIDAIEARVDDPLTSALEVDGQPAEPALLRAGML